MSRRADFNFFVARNYFVSSYVICKAQGQNHQQTLPLPSYTESERGIELETAGSIQIPEVLQNIYCCKITSVHLIMISLPVLVEAIMSLTCVCFRSSHHLLCHVLPSGCCPSHLNFTSLRIIVTKSVESHVSAAQNREASNGQV